MSVMRIIAALFATACLVLGFLMGHQFEQGFGQTLFIAGAIVICGILISSAILERNKKP
jgi:putative Mn2+ efflux pump MntP